MTRIDFYLLSAASENRLLFTCRLVDKIYSRGHRLYVHTESSVHAAEVDNLLWSFSAGFVPHDLYQAVPDASTTIQIGSDPAPSLAPSTDPDNDVLVNLAIEVPGFFSRFARIAEIVGPDETSKQQARERFRFYRDRGYTLESHTL
jgi:DNA polymerase-3 subunit chi